MKAGALAVIAIIISMVALSSGTIVIRFQGDRVYPIAVQDRAGVTLYDYVVPIELTRYNFGDWDVLISAPDSIYFLDDTGSCIPFWIEYFDEEALYAKIWVKVPVVPSGGRSFIYMHYGGANQCPGYNNASMVFIIYDDFSTGNLSDTWEVIDIAPNLSGGYLEIDNDDFGFIRAYLPSSMNGVELRVVAQDLVLNDDADLYLELEYSDRYGYELQLDGTNYEILWRNDGTTFVRMSMMYISIDPSVPHELILRKSPNKVEGCFDGYCIQGLDNTYTVNSVAIGIYWYSSTPDTIRIFQVMVRPYIDPEPLVIYPVPFITTTTTITNTTTITETVVQNITTTITETVIHTTTTTLTTAVANETITVMNTTTTTVTTTVMAAVTYMEMESVVSTAVVDSTLITGLMLISLAGTLGAIVAYPYSRPARIAILLALLTSMLMSLALMASRAAIPTAYKLENGTLSYIYEPNPYARMYIVPILMSLVGLIIYVFNTIIRKEIEYVVM